jgi:hypothetical protein
MEVAGVVSLAPEQLQSKQNETTGHLALYVLECPAYSTIRDQYVHISQAAASAVDGGEDVSRAMLQLFVPSHLQELAAFLRKAYSTYRLRFPRNGSLRLTAQAATDGANAPAGGDGDDDGSTSGDDDSDVAKDGD